MHLWFCIVSTILLASATLHSTNPPSDTFSKDIFTTPLFSFNTLEEPTHTTLLSYPLHQNAFLATCTINESSTDVPITIVAATANTVSSDLSITLSGSITDVNITNLDIDHTYISDLEIILEAPDGTRVNVLDNICGGQDDINLSLDDEASNSSFPCPPTNGANYQPSFSLSGFDGLEMNGTWILEINDQFDADGGSLNSWGLEIEYTCGPVEVCDDGIDNDGDGDIDCDDTDCDGNPLCPILECEESLASTDVPLIISPTTGATIYSDLVVNQTGDITDINITNLDITHTYIDDVIVILESPTGTRVTVLNQPCGGQDDIDIEIDDEAATSNFPCPPVDGNAYIGANLLSAFDGEDMQGTWILEIQDVYPTLDGGSLNSWGLEITYECDPVEICDDGIDNDGNGLIDCADPACNGEVNCTPDCVTGTILVETFTGISGNSISNLTSAAIYPDSPSTTEYDTDLNRPNNFADNYGTRIRGYIIPSETGDYIFNITSDDHSELHLSTDNNPANSSLIANIIGWAPEGNHTKFASQTSASITLQAGTYYYIEVLQKEGGSGDNLEVYWQTPSNANWTIIPSVNISAYICEELCDDGIDNDGDGDIDCDDDYCGQPIITSVASSDPDNCPILNNGSITITASGSNLEYSIDGGVSYQSNATFNNLSQGNYTIRIRNSTTNCFIEYATSVSLIDPTCLEICDDNIDNDGDGDVDCDDADCGMPSITSVTSTDPDNCPSLNNGTITIVGSGSNLEYSINNGTNYQPSGTFTGLSDGNFTIRVRNSITECFVLYAITITLTDPVCIEICDDNIDNDGDGDIDCDDLNCGTPSISSITPSNPSNCPTLDNGSITITASGSNLEYSINGGTTYQSSNIFTGLSDGNYTIRIRNTVTGCFIENASATTLIDPSCLEICDDTIDNDGDSNIDCDDLDCSPEIIGLNYAHADNCPTLNDGSISISASGNNMEYSIDNGTTFQNSNTFTNLIQGQYNVIVRNNVTGCEVSFDSNPININSPVCVEICNNNIDDDGDGLIDCDDTDCQPSLSIETNDTEICPGENIVLETAVCENYQNLSLQRPLMNDGWNNAYATGGSGITGDGELCFTLNDYALSSLQTFGLNYDPHTDNNYTGIDFSINIAVRPDLNKFILQIRENGNVENVPYDSATSIVGQNICIRRTGTLIEYLLDGTVIYTSSQSSTGILYYDHSIHSSNSSSIYIDGYSYFTDISLCGALDLNYLWSDSSTSDQLNVTTGGNYALTITDIYGCTSSSNVTITNGECPEICDDNLDNDGDGDIDCDDSDCGKPTFTSVIDSNPNNCPSLNDGSITIVANGSNIEYSIDNGISYQNNGTFTNLSAGNYSVILRNSETGCTEIYAANPIIFTQISCPEICDDGIDNDLDGDIDCDDSDCGTPALTSVNIQNISDCINLDDGQIAIATDNAANNGASIEFSIDNGATWSNTSIFSNLSMGTYNVQLRYAGIACYIEYENNPIQLIAENCPEICDDAFDNDGDGDIDCDDLECIPVIDTVNTKNADNCPLLNNGFIHINMSVNAEYEYSIDGGTFYQSNKNFNGLSAGNYNVRIRKIGTDCFTEYANNPVVIINENCVEECNDGIDNDGDGLIDCEDSDCFSGTIEDIIFSNPDNCPILDNGSITIDARGPNLIYSIDDGITFSTTNSFNNLMNGNYYIIIQDTITGCELEYAANPFMLLDIPCPEICDDGIDNDGDGLIDCEDGGCGTPSITSVTPINPSNCPSLDNGRITIKALGLNLEYSIDGGNTYHSTSVFTGLENGAYTIFVRNSVTGCATEYASNNIILTDPVCVEICGDGIDNDGDGNTDCDDSDCETPNIIQVISNAPDNCPLLDNGFINIFASGDYKEFSIDGGITYQASNQFTNLSGGDYNIRVRNTESGCYTDYNGNSITLNDPICIEICGDGIDNDGDGNADCDDPDCGAPIILSATTVIVDNCPDLDNGSITISAIGSNLLYSINGGITFQTSNSFTGLVSGDYTVIVKNGITGCEIDYAFNPLNVDEIICPEICDDGIDNDGDGLIDCEDPDCNPASIDQVIFTAPDNCPTLNNGTVTIIATGNDLEYSITNGIIYQDSPNFTGLYNGAFNIKIRNKVTGCVLAYENNPLVVLDPECSEICDDGIDNDGDGNIDCADGDCGTPSSVGEDHTDPDNCYELNNGNILMDAVGSNIEWSIDGGLNFQGDPSFDNLVAGTYYLVARNTVTGCEANGPTVTLFNSSCDEICDDGVDNDGDGLIDCEDGNCGAPTIGLVNAYDPYNCPDLDNGSLTITGSGNNLEYSIDGGATYQSTSTFTDLIPGNYTVQLINTSTGCVTPYPNNPVVLLDPICGEICDDGIDNDGDGDIDCEDSECVNASNTYMIDFDLDTPVITKYTDQVATVEGNVLFAVDGSDAGFNYIVSIVIDGGPAGGSAVNFPAGSVLNDAEFNTDDPSIVYNGAQTVIDLDLQGRENINGTINYYRDNTSNMLVTMYLDNGQAFSNIQYTIVDIDMDLTGSAGDYAGAYIDQVQILSGAGTNTITPYNSSFVKVDGDVARANFTDNNNNNLPDQHEFIQAQTYNPAGNITVNTPGTIGKVQFVYSDFNAAVEGTGANFHEFNSGNQRIGLGTYMTFESGCQVIEICYDNIDNDGDGLIDCEDNDCDPVITFLGATNTDNCPLLDNGTITIQAIGSDLEFSVDGGITYQSSNEFTNLTAGSYDIWVQNSVSGCNVDYAFNPVVIVDPICVEICDDGIDNDGNGLTDCEDPACDAGDITNVILVDPSNCPENDNGSITITASGDNLEYSIDGGVSYQSSNLFTNLVARNYTVVIRDSNSGCLSGYPTNPISLSPTNCDCIGVDNNFRANFENTSGDNVWTFTNGASDGNFVIGEPNPYTMSSTLMEIVPYRGTKDLLTGIGFQQDLDGGEAIARSRDISLSEHVTDISFDLQYYFSHLNNSSSADYLRIEILNAADDNVLTTVVSENGASSYRSALWTGASADLTSYAGETIYIRVRSSDAGGGSKLEIAIDDVEIIETPDVTLNLPFTNFCMENASFVLSGGLPFGGVYSGPGIIDGATFNADIAGTGSHTITYTYTSNDGCEIIATDVVDVGEVTITGSTSPISICLGESTLIEAPTVVGEAPFEYNWDNDLNDESSHTVSPLVNTQYNVTITDNLGCTASTFINVIVNQPPSTNLKVDGSNCYEEGITQLDLDVSGGAPGYTFSYSSPHGFTSNEQNPIVPSYGLYYVTVTDSNGCTALDTVEVFPAFEPEVDGDENVCYGTAAILTVTPSNLSYEWGTFAGGATTDQISVTPLSTTTYTVTVTNNDGCTSSANFIVVVNDLPELELTADVNTACSGAEVNLSATILNFDDDLNYFYQWSHGDLTPSSTVNPIESTTYLITITDSNMCQTVDSISITINDAEIENVTLGSNVDCDGACTGEMLIDVNYPVTGPFTIYYDYAGTTYSSGPYDFGTDVDTAIVIGDLCAGSYNNIMIQSTTTGCTDTWIGDDIEISESHADWEHVTLTSGLSNCSGICDGSFTVDANLGVTGEFEISYTYDGNVITNGPFNFAGDILIDGLCEGTYSDITITSLETGCQDIWPTDIEITTPDPEANIVTLIDDDCQIDEGSVTINVSGGALPYTIHWRSEDGTETGSQVFTYHGNHSIYGLSGNTTYCFEVEDDNGCSTGD